MKINIGLFSRIFVIIYFMGLCGVAATILIPREADIAAVGSTFAFTFYWLIMYAITGLLFVLQPKWYRFSKAEVLLIFLGVYAIISTLWSKLPSQTFLYSVSLFANIIFAIYLSRRYQFDDFILLIAKIVLAIGVLGVILYFIGYEKTIFIDPLDRSNFLGFIPVKGLFSHKIYAGVYGSLIIPVLFFKFKGWSKLISLTLLFIAIFMTGSATGLLLCVFIFLILMFFKYVIGDTINLNNLLVLILIVFCSLIFLVIGMPIIFESVGRDSSLTGRTELWSWAIWFFGQKPIGGWGYFGIFSDALNAPSQIIFKGTYYKAPHFHNIYLQVLAELGIIGFSVYFFIILKVFKRAISQVLNIGGYNNIQVLLMCVVLFIAGFVVNVGFKYNEFFTLIVLFLYLKYRNNK